MDVFDLHTMKREESVSSPFSVALGNFDGVHLGHAELIKRCVEYARRNNMPSAVWTFGDSAGCLPNKKGVHCLTPTAQKLELIAEMGVDYAILEEFDDVRMMSPEQFVRERLIQTYGAVCAVCGYNFRFGYRGAGDCNLLTELMKPYDVIVVPPCLVEGVPVSSTAIRALVEGGDVEAAARLLGRPFAIELPVVEGKKLGRTIGIPTVNQNFARECVIPQKGIYASVVSVGGELYSGVTNVGVRPSVPEDSHFINCETHIIGFDGELYGETVKVSFIKRIRDERRFESIEALKEQIERDIGNVRELFRKGLR